MSKPPATPPDPPAASLWDVVAADPAIPMGRDTLRLVIRDQQRLSRAALYPWIRILSRVAVTLIVAGKRACPVRFSAHATMDRMCLWFLRRFVSPDAVTLLIRHFIVETNLLLAAVASRSRPWPGPGGARGSGRKAKMRRLSQRNRRPNAVGNADSACNACYGCLPAIGLLGAVRRTPGAGGRLWSGSAHGVASRPRDRGDRVRREPAWWSWHAGAVDGQAEVQR